MPHRCLFRNFNEELLRFSLELLDSCLVRRPPFRKPKLGSSRHMSGRNGQVTAFAASTGILIKSERKAVSVVTWIASHERSSCCSPLPSHTISPMSYLGPVRVSSARRGGGLAFPTLYGRRLPIVPRRMLILRARAASWPGPALPGLAWPGPALPGLARPCLVPAWPCCLGCLGRLGRQPG